MIFDGRVRMLDSVHGSVTVVSSYASSAAERERALSEHEVQGLLLRLFHGAESGSDRHTLVSLHQLAVRDLTMYWRVTSSQLLEELGRAVANGAVLFVEGWDLSDRRSAQGPRADVEATMTSPEGRVIARIMRGRAETLVSGERYRLLAARTWNARDHEGWTVVRRDEAVPALRLLASHAGSADERSALGEAAHQSPR